MKEQDTEEDRNNIANPKIFADLIRILYKNLLVSVPASFICSTLIFFCFNYHAKNIALVPWFAAMAIVSIFRLAIYLLYTYKTFNDKASLDYFLVGVTLTAALWGILGSILMPSGDLLQQMIVIVIIAGITAGGAQTLAANIYALAINLCVIVIPLCIWIFMQNDVTYIFLGIAISAYLIFMLAASVRNHRLLRETIMLHYENLSLVNNLTESNNKLYSSYKLLEKHENELSYINKLNFMLQSSKEVNEAYFIVSNVAKDLFSGFSGTLSIYNSETDKMVVMTGWGEGCALKNNIKFHDCWGLRNGKEFHANDSDTETVCSHFDKNPGSHMCMPLLGQYGTYGLLTLCSNKKNAFTSYIVQLVTSFSEVIQLSLINLSLRESLYEQSIHDSLTGLYNRRYLNVRLSAELERTIREKKSLCVAMLDLDHFKKINDKLGHDVGDELLKFIGKKLSTNFRKEDIAFRYGGEEFLIVLGNTTIEKAYKRLLRINQEVKTNTIYFDGRQLPPITISIGIAEAPRQGKTMKEILQSADSALYTAKESGRDKVICFNPNIHHSES